MKWWFSDFDGTINLDQKNKILDKDLFFIKNWINKGNKFVIATGRFEKEISKILDAYEIDYEYLICNNGALVYQKTKGIINNASIPMESRQQIIDLIEKLKDKYSIGYCLKENGLPYSKVYQEDIYENPYLSNYVPQQNNFEQGKKDILNSQDLNIIYFFVSECDVETVKNILNGSIDNCKAMRTHKNIVEIVRSDVSKALGIKIVQNINNFKNEDVITSGDNENDIEMLELTKNSFAVKSNNLKVEKVANHVINNVHEIENYLK